ncbi:MAG TPA: 1-acyl-sn-glycerol-3-phosphate acyltransferase, partial [Myxococcota bacterium]|nr:1-acyl-sn-glycerol-3-phosphate acyltransferase [Myxococcota bacterium]
PPAQTHLALAAATALGAAYTWSVVPEFVLRFFAFGLSNVMYRVRVEGAARVPIDGPCVLVCNHVSFVDWLILSGAVPRPPRFVMDRDIARTPVLRWLFEHARCIPITSRKVDPELVDRAMDAVSAELRDGGVVCIFPEGRLTPDGEVCQFRKGIEDIIGRDPVPVVPMALDGLWGSFFSRKDGQAFKRPFRRWWSRVRLTIGEPVPAEQVSADGLRDEVLRLLAR